MASLTWQGEFASHLRERRYRIAHWPMLAARMRFFCGFTSLLYVALAVADYMALGATPVFYSFLSLRLVCFCIGWGNVLLTFSRRFMDLLPWSVALYMFALGATEAAQAGMLAATPSEGQMLFTACLALTYYIFLPPRLMAAVLGAVAASAAYVVSLSLFSQTPAETLLAAALFFLLVNCFGAYFLRSANISARRVYHAMREERLLSRRLRRETAERRKAQAQLQLLATTDDLTGLFNRRRFLDLCRHELARYERYGQPLSLLLLDVDRLRTINDTYGHDAGDLVLQSLANRCADQLRTTDMPGRLGGEEFGVLLPCTPLEDAVGVAQKLCDIIAETPLVVNNLELPVTVSIGVVAANAKTAAPEDMLQLADQALDLAKQRGYNRVCSSAELPAREFPASAASVSA